MMMFIEKKIDSLGFCLIPPRARHFICFLGAWMLMTITGSEWWKVFFIWFVGSVYHTSYLVVSSYAENSSHYPFSHVLPWYIIYPDFKFVTSLFFPPQTVDISWWCNQNRSSAVQKKRFSSNCSITITITKSHSRLCRTHARTACLQVCRLRSMT